MKFEMIRLVSCESLFSEHTNYVRRRLARHGAWANKRQIESALVYNQDEQSVSDNLSAIAAYNLCSLLNDTDLVELEK